MKSLVWDKARAESYKCAKNPIDRRLMGKIMEQDYIILMRVDKGVRDRNRW